MRVVTMAPALRATEEEDGGLSLSGFPLTSAFVESLPIEITIPVVVVVCALAGDEYTPTLYLAAESPSGQRVSTMEFGWEWPDWEDVGVKYRAFVQYLPLYLETEGTYLLSLLDRQDGDPNVHTFPLPVFLNPNAAP